MFPLTLALSKRRSHSPHKDCRQNNKLVTAGEVARQLAKKRMPRARKRPLHNRADERCGEEALQTRRRSATAVLPPAIPAQPHCIRNQSPGQAQRFGYSFGTFDWTRILRSPLMQLPKLCPPLSPPFSPSCRGHKHTYQRYQSVIENQRCRSRSHGVITGFSSSRRERSGYRLVAVASASLPWRVSA